MTRKRSILFVGSFRAPSDGRIGGQFFACRSLVDSDLKNDFDFITLDSTLESIRVKSVVFRLHRVALRFVTYVLLIFTRRVDVALLFSSSGMSFVEKGVMALIAKALGKRVIVAPRSGYLITNVRKNKWFKYFLRVVIRSSDAILCQSLFWKEFFLKIDAGSSVDKFTVIENWLPEKYFVLPTRKSNLLDDAPLAVLYFNRIEEEKGVFDFLWALEMLQRQGVKVTASIYGDGTKVQAVKELVSSLSLSNVEFRGWLNDSQKNIIQDFDLYVFTSHFEGFPNSLLEVMAYGVPIISTRVGSVNDIIIPGYNGVLVDRCSPTQLADAIKELAANRELLHLFSQRSLGRVRKFNSLDVAILGFRKLLNRIL